MGSSGVSGALGIGKTATSSKAVVSPGLEVFDAIRDWSVQGAADREGGALLSEAC
jgi:hypothetical protein